MTDEDELLKAEIAKLSGAIQTHKQHASPSSSTYSSYPASSFRGRGSYPSTSSYRGTFRGRGGYAATHINGRGRGRGTPVPPRNRTLVLNDPSTKAATSSSTTTSASGNDASPASVSNGPSAPTEPPQSTSSAVPTSNEGWIKRKSTHNMSLVSKPTFEKTEPARLAALAASQKAKEEARASRKQSSSTSATMSKGKGKPGSSSSSVRRGDNMGEVVIDGVVFEFDPSGTKLVKKFPQPSSNDPSAASSSASSSTRQETEAAVPLKTSINGQNYIRTKRGNLISAELLAKRRAQKEALAKMNRLKKMVGQISNLQASRNAAASSSRKGSVPSGNLSASKLKASKTLCAFFNKTGQCKRGLSCPYIHDVNKIALCPRILRPKGCSLPKGTCPLSHDPRPERVPHCVHYLRSRECRNGERCIYTHSDKLEKGLETKICRAFSDYGWCDNGKDCTQRHTYECPDFVENGGKCNRKNCKLLHVIRATPQQTSQGKDGDEVSPEQTAFRSQHEEAEDLQDGDLFMRDDAAAADGDDGDGDDDDESTNVATSGQGGKRKRPLFLTTDSSDSSQHDAVNQLSFGQGSTDSNKKRKRTKAFTQQKDFISFDDDDDDDDEDMEGEDRESGEGRDSSDDDEEEEEEDQEEEGSVHSEELEFSDSDEDESDADESGSVEEAQQTGKVGDEQWSDGEGEGDDDDDDNDRVDRDL